MMDNSFQSCCRRFCSRQIGGVGESLEKETSHRVDRRRWGQIEEGRCQHMIVNERGEKKLLMKLLLLLLRMMWTWLSMKVQ